MGLRGFLGFLLVVAIAFTFGSYMFFNFTDHDTGQKVFSKMISDRISKEVSAQDLSDAEKDVAGQCQDKEFLYLNLTNDTLKVNCSQVGNLPFKAVFANAVYDNIYYKSYDCSFLDCLESSKKLPALIASQTHQKYWIYYLYLLCADVILAVLLFAVSSGWHRKANSFGYVFLISGLGALPFYVTQMIFGAQMEFMNKIFYFEIIMFILGVILLVWGSVLKSRHKKMMQGEGNYEED